MNAEFDIHLLFSESEEEVAAYCEEAKESPTEHKDDPRASCTAE